MKKYLVSGLALALFACTADATPSDASEDTGSESAELITSRTFLGGIAFRPVQLINFEQVVTPFPVAARQIELVAPAGCAYVRSGNVLVNSASWDYRPANGGLVELVFVGQYVAGGYIHARYNIGVSFGGAPGTQPASIVDATRLVLSPVTRFSACDIAAYALL